ncbi:MAG: bifunctional metallophosphatase/5'-nucleotidase [Anaerolineae bacterium]
MTEGAVVVLDSGNTLFGTALSFRAKGEPIVDAMNAMGYDVMAVGAMDLAFGVDTFQARRSQAKFAIVSANLLTTDGKPFVDPYVVLERKGLRIGIIGITEPDAELQQTSTAIRGLLSSEDPVTALNRYLPELRAKADIVILLSRLGLERDVALAKAVPGIDIIVGGSSRTLMQQPQKVGSTLIVQQGYNGEWIGRTAVQYDDQGQVVKSTTEGAALGPDITDDPELAALVKRWAQLFPSPTPAPKITATPSS